MHSENTKTERCFICYAPLCPDCGGCTSVKPARPGEKTVTGCNCDS